MNGDVTVREVMDREFVGVSESDDLLEAVEVMLDSDAENVVVLRGSDPVGVVTQRHVLEFLVAAGDIGGATVAEAMTDSVPTIEATETVTAAADAMGAQSTRLLLATEGGELEGIVTESDVLAAASLDPDPDARIGTDADLQAPTDRERATDRNADRTRAEQAGEPIEQGAVYEDQGICEACGTLARDLSAFNGQLLCADCRDI